MKKGVGNDYCLNMFIYNFVKAKSLGGPKLAQKSKNEKSPQGSDARGNAFLVGLETEVFENSMPPSISLKC